MCRVAGSSILSAKVTNSGVVVSRLPVTGESFGRYVLERKLGQGGMGVVHVARDTVLNRKVALKLVAPHLAEDEEFRVRFAREAETQARLDSPHVVRINDYGEHDGILFLSTQLVEGGDLASRVVSGDESWSVGGRTLSGTRTNNGSTLYRWGRYWSSSENTWGVFISSSSSEGRRLGIDRIDSYRALQHVKGVPCSEASC